MHPYVAPPTEHEVGIDEELERLEGPRWPGLEPQSYQTKLWKRSYLIALHAIGVLTERVKKLKQLHPDTAWIFFYPDVEDDLDKK